MADENRTTEPWDQWENGHGFPAPTPTTRAEVGCYRKTVDSDCSECWCGYPIVGEFGSCPQCYPVEERANG